MPGVNKDGTPSKAYNYDVGGGSKKIGGIERGDKMPASGEVGRQNALNTNRFFERKTDDGNPAPVYKKTGYESSAFNKSGFIKDGVKSDVKFLESDGSWAPAEGRGKGGSDLNIKRGTYSGEIKGK